MNNKESRVCRQCKAAKPLSEYHNTVSSLCGKYATCKECIKAKNTRWRLANKDKVKASKKNYALHYAEEIKRKAAGHRKTEKYQANMRSYRREWNLAKRYGITIDQYEQFLEGMQWAL